MNGAWFPAPEELAAKHVRGMFCDISQTLIFLTSAPNLTSNRTRVLFTGDLSGSTGDLS